MCVCDSPRFYTASCKWTVMALQSLASGFGVWELGEAMAEVPQCLVRGQLWAKEALGLLGVDKSTLLWSASPIPSSSMFSGACYPERALEYICAARRSVDPSLPPLTDSNLWLRTFSVAQCFRCIVQETPSFGHLIMSSYRMGCNKQNGNLLVTGLQWRMKTIMTKICKKKQRKQWENDEKLWKNNENNEKMMKNYEKQNENNEKMMKKIVKTMKK